MKQTGDERKSIIQVSIILAVLVFLFLQNSELSPFGNGKSSADSSVFRTVAMMMDRGFMPYRDSFDHKGPLLYLIDYVGMKLSFTHGIWIMEYISLFLTGMVFIGIARLAGCDDRRSLLSTLIALSMLGEYFDHGNLAEEYAMPFIAAGLYLFLDFLLNDRLGGLRSICCGLCLGAVLLLRPNMIGLWVIFCPAVLIRGIRTGEIGRILGSMAFFFFSLAAMVLPVLLWLSVNGAIHEFWDAYIVFNGMYASGMSGRAGLGMFLGSMYTFSSGFVFQAALIAMILSFMIDKENRFTDGAYILYMVMNIPLLAMSGQTYGHYGMLLIPSLILPAAKIVNFIGKMDNRALTGFAAAFFLINAFLYPAARTAYSIYECISDRGRVQGSAGELIDTIVENTAPDDRISVYGNDDWIYLLSRRMHATRYSYQFPIGTVRPGIMEEYWEEMRDEQPALIVFTRRADEKAAEFIEENAYSLLWQGKDEYFLVYIKE